MRVKLTKIAGADDSRQKIGYWVTGLFLHKPTVGVPLSLLRDVRNGVHQLGFFTSSPVAHLETLDCGITIVTTENSTWEMVEL